MAKYRVYSSESRALDNACCPEAVSKKSEGVWYAQIDLCDCIEECEKEAKIDDIKVTKEFKVKRKTK